MWQSIMRLHSIQNCNTRITLRGEVFERKPSPYFLGKVYDLYIVKTCDINKQYNE